MNTIKVVDFYGTLVINYQSVKCQNPEECSLVKNKSQGTMEAVEM
jgi:hypothetical protein